MKKAIIVGICLMAIGCTTSQISVALNVASLATNVAASTIAGVALDPVVKSEVTFYLTTVSNTLNEAATDLQAGQLTGAEIAKISSTLVQTIVPKLPATVPTVVKIALEAVAAGVGAFVALLNPLPKSAATLSKDATVYKFKLSFRDRQLVRDSLVQLKQAKVLLGN